MTDTTDLVARLRSYGPGSPEMNLMPLFRVAWEAADAIERLTRERDEARAALNSLLSYTEYALSEKAVELNRVARGDKP